MRRILLPLLAAMAMAGAARGQAPAETITQDAVELAVGRVKPALVRIHVVSEEHYEGRSIKSESSGSGAVISPDGYVVTNHHVAGKAVRLKVTMWDREEIPAELVGTDAMADIAVIKLKPGRERKFEFAEWGDSDKLLVGQPVLSMGSPLALSQSVTQGIVSNSSMTMPSGWGNFQLDGEDVGAIVRWIAHDAVIFPGNSGGPLVDMQGRIVGINEISMGLGGAIPGNLARTVALGLIDQGRIDRSWLGLVMQPTFKQDENTSGVIISDTVEGSPARRAGLKPGDRLLRLGDRATDVRFGEELPPLNLYVANLERGTPVDAVFARDGLTSRVTITPTLREPVLPREREFVQWGMSGRNLSSWTALELDRETTAGVLVTSLRPGGPAGQAKPEIQEGDIMMKVAGEPVTSMDELTSLTRRLTEGKEDPVPAVVEFERKKDQLLTVVEVGVRDLDDPGREVEKAWVPVSFQVLTRDLARQLEIEETEGVRVTRLYEDGSSTAGLGLKVGDIIVEFDGEPVPARDVKDYEVFPTMVRQYPIGTEVGLKVLREGKEVTLAGTLPGRPRQPREMEQYQDVAFGLTVRNVAYLDRKTNRWGEDAKGGVLVTGVERGGWAALARLQVGDLLMEINGKPVTDVEQVKTLLEAMREEKPRQVILKVHRDTHTMFTEIEPIWDEL